MSEAQNTVGRANYLRWFIGDSFAALGSSVSTFAFPLITLAVTGSPQLTGFVALMQGIGALMGTAPGGVLADRFNRKSIRMMGGACGVLLQVALALVLLLGAANAPVLATLAFTSSLRAGLCSPASQALLKQVVTKEDLPGKFAINQGRDSAIDLAGGPAGGALLGLAQFFPPLAAACGNLVAFFTSWRLTGDFTVREKPAGKGLRSALSDVREAVIWVGQQRMRLQIVIVTMVVNFAGTGLFFTVNLGLAAQQVPYVQIGLVASGFSLAVILGSLLTPQIITRASGGLICLCTLGLVSAASIGIAVYPTYWVMFGGLAVTGLGVAPLVAVVLGHLAQQTPMVMMGRVDSLTTLASSALMPLAPAIAGFALGEFGLRATLGIFAAGSLAALLMAVLLRGGIRSIPVIGVKPQADGPAGTS